MIRQTDQLWHKNQGNYTIFHGIEQILSRTDSKGKGGMIVKYYFQMSSKTRPDIRIRYGTKFRERANSFKWKSVGEGLKDQIS